MRSQPSDAEGTGADEDRGGFRVQETHGILWRPENNVRMTSKGLGWRSLYASAQHEAPYSAEFAAVRDHLIVLHLDGPVGVARMLGTSEARRVVAPGGLFILPGGMDFGVRLEGPLDSLHVYVRREVVEDLARELRFAEDSIPQLVPRLGVHDPLLEQLALNIVELLTERTSQTALYADCTARLMAAQLLRKHSTASAIHPEPANPRAIAAVDRVIRFMEANLSSRLSLPRLAEAGGVSPSRLSRLFKQATGLPPHRYLLSLRVERAKTLLLKDDSIVDVALSCGFSHQEHLTNVFRKHTRCTPAAYRQTKLQGRLGSRYPNR